MTEPLLICCLLEGLTHALTVIGPSGTIARLDLLDKVDAFNKITNKLGPMRAAFALPDPPREPCGE